MGKMSIILVLSAFLTAGAVLYNTHRTTLQIDEQTYAHTFRSQARSIAKAGLEREMSTVIAQVTATIPPQPWSSFTVTETALDGGSYRITAVRGTCNSITQNQLQTDPILALAGPNQYLEVTSTARVRPGGSSIDILHEIVACYVKLDRSDVRPPALEYAFISNDFFDFRGGISIDTLNGEGHIHSNDAMDLSPQVRITGHATFTNEGESSRDGATVSSWQWSEGVPMTPFDPMNYVALAQREGHRYDSNSPSLTNGQIIGPENFNSLSPEDIGTAENPYYWFINGDLILNGNIDIRLPAYTVVVITGDMKIDGNASITVSGTSPSQHTTTRAWADANTGADGHGKIAFYVNGNYMRDGSVNPEGPTDGVVLGGTGNIVGNIYTNADFTLSGGGQASNIVGSVAALGEVTASGGGQGNRVNRNFWYTSMAQEIVIPGIRIPREAIGLVAISEWIDPVIRNTGGPTTP
jgi:hypothetical protein